jgi:hypothetical protein
MARSHEVLPGSPSVTVLAYVLHLFSARLFPHRLMIADAGMISAGRA